MLSVQHSRVAILIHRYIYSLWISVYLCVCVSIYPTRISSHILPLYWGYHFYSPAKALEMSWNVAAVIWHQHPKKKTSRSFQTLSTHSLCHLRSMIPMIGSSSSSSSESFNLTLMVWPGWSPSGTSCTGRKMVFCDCDAINTEHERVYIYIYIHTHIIYLYITSSLYIYIIPIYIIPIYILIRVYIYICVCVCNIYVYI